jgi:hypothetical protein
LMMSCARAVGSAPSCTAASKLLPLPLLVVGGESLPLDSTSDCVGNSSDACAYADTTQTRCVTCFRVGPSPR